VAAAPVVLFWSTPTAIQNCLATQLTEYRRARSAAGPVETGSPCCQLWPFHSRAAGVPVAPFNPVRSTPVATQREGPTQERPASPDPSDVVAGGTGTTDQAVPFHSSMRAAMPVGALT